MASARGVSKGIKRIESFNTEQSDKPEYILLIANHDPDKRVLERELNDLLNSPVYSIFKQRADLIIAVASYMGYGLYQECILDVKDFMDKHLNKRLKSKDSGIATNQNIEIEFKLEKIMNDLNYKFMSLEEYKWKCSKGVLVEKKILEDDLAFYNANSDNPMASENRFVRINAADKLMRIVKENRTYISEEIVDFLNMHLSDCCAPVRQSIMFSLILIANKKSLEFYKRLVYIEESPSTKNMLEYVIDDIESGKNDLLGNPELKYFLT